MLLITRKKTALKLDVWQVWLWNGVWPRKKFQSKYICFALIPVYIYIYKVTFY